VRVTGERRRFDCADEGQLEEGLAAAAEEVEANRLVVLPTDTVYGIAADAFQAPAVRRLLRAKGRGRNMPPPVLIAAAATLDSLAAGVPAYAREMVEELWPGPLTLICTQQPSLKWDLGDNRATVAVRVPDHPVAVALLERTGPLAVSSANRTGMPAASNVDEAEEMLGDRVKVYLDAGPSRTSLASTILDVTNPRPRVLRRGGIPLSRLQEFEDSIVDAVADPDDDQDDDGGDRPRRSRDDGPGEAG
jgi:L-threonylcarbamoyladenylate synthase